MVLLENIVMSLLFFITLFNAQRTHSVNLKLTADLELFFVEC